MPMPNIITVEEISTPDSITVNPESAIDTITLEDNASPIVVQISTIETTAMVQSVNGKTGHVVIDYPDINSSPVNHVKYVHSQVEVSNTWTINHNLGFFPNVTILDNDTPPRIVEADIRYTNSNTVIINMNTAMSGTAYLT